MKKSDIISLLKLTKHIEGGYFGETYKSPYFMQLNEDNSLSRHSMTSMYYLMTNDEPVSYFHLDKSDIICYFHGGSPITYLLISPDGKLEKFVLGFDITKGHSPQLLIKGGYWQAAILTEGEFGLLSEAVSPGFNYDDLEIATHQKLCSLFPHLQEEIYPYIKRSKNSMPTLNNKDAIISKLNLKKLSEVGGYFSEVYKSPHCMEIAGNSRSTVTSIYYFLTDEESIGYFHIDKSDVIHFFHSGHPVTFLTINSEGNLKETVLGPDVSKGHVPQMLVKGGTWKSAILKEGEFGLLSEIVSPGFHESEEKLGNSEILQKLFPQLWEKIKFYVKDYSEVLV